MQPKKPPFQILIEDATERATNIYLSKTQDYGSGSDAFAALRGSEGFGIPAWISACIRVKDKLQRIESFIQRGVLSNESVEDALDDAINYAILARALYDENLQRDPNDPDLYTPVDMADLINSMSYEALRNTWVFNEEEVDPSQLHFGDINPEDDSLV